MKSCTLPIYLIPAVASTLLLPTVVKARDIPTNVQSFYNSIVSSPSVCESPLATGFYSTDVGSDRYVYCGDHVNDFGIIYIAKRESNGIKEKISESEIEEDPPGSLTNMDVDCDGAYNATTDDGRCSSSTDTQSITSFQDIIVSYGFDSLSDIDANVHPYVVFGNVAGGYATSDNNSRDSYAEYDPMSDGIVPLSLMAVVCNGRLVYGVWGDYNGDDGGRSLVGEASISLATLCFGDGVNGDNGHDADDVLYIAFQGKDAVPGAAGANWTAGDAEVFEKSLEKLGDSLVQRITAAATRPRWEGILKTIRVVLVVIGATALEMLL